MINIIPLEIRDLIDQAVHDVIHEGFQNYSDGLESRCAIYAIVGARFLSELTGKTYHPACGAQVIPLTDGTEYFMQPQESDIASAGQLSDVKQYHCWIKSEGHAQDAVEIVDFTVRHHEVACRLLGITPRYFYDETYAWSKIPLDKIGKSSPEDVYYYSSCLLEDARLTQLLSALHEENKNIFNFLNQQCLQKFHGSLSALKNVIPALHMA